MKGLMIFSICMIICSGQAMAVQICATATVTASTPTADFIDNGDGTVTHTKTGLMWKRCSEGQTWNGSNCTGTAMLYTWQGALQQAEVLNNGGGFATFTNWRLPNIKELGSIVEEQCTVPSYNITIFPSASDSAYTWSASPFAANASKAWAIAGNDFVAVKSGSGFARLVRGGQ